MRRRVEENGYLSPCLDVLKIKIERKGNDFVGAVFGAQAQQGSGSGPKVPQTMNL